MTATIDVLDTEFAGAMKVRIVEMDITSYTAGGEPFTPSDVGMHRFQYVSAEPDENGYVANYDYDNEEVRVFKADYDAAADGPLIDAGGTTDAGVIRLFCVGR